MAIIKHAFIALTVILQLQTSRAGEIVLYTNNKCSSSPRIFPSSKSVPCAKAEGSFPSNDPIVFSVSTSRNIGPGCTFALYTDAKCKKLAQKIHSDGPLKNCLPIKAGLRSYKISCSKKVSNKPLAIPKRLDDWGDEYFQPRVQFRGKNSGHTNFGVANPFRGGDKYKPSGSAPEAAYRLASAFGKQVPKGGARFITSAVSGGTTYRLELLAAKDNKYTAESAFAKIGEAGFASMLAGAIVTITKQPSTYLYWDIYNQDHLDEAVADFNLTYT